MREGRVIPVIYSAAELTKVLDHLDAECRLFIELMALAGLRKTGAIEARVGDIDLDSGQLIVRGGDEGTKSGHHRIVPILSTRLHTTLSAAINTGKQTKRRRFIEHVEPRNAIGCAAAKAKSRRWSARTVGARGRPPAARGVDPHGEGVAGA